MSGVVDGEPVPFHEYERLRRAYVDTKARLDALVRASPAGIAVVDEQLKVSLWNAAAERVLGVPRMEAIGRELPVDAEQRAWLKSALEALDAPSPHRARRTVDAGNVIEVMLHAAPLKDERGAGAGAVLMFQDITEQALLAERMQQAQRLESVGRLAGGIAHDFNNVLMALLGAVEALRLLLPPGGETHEDLDDMEEAIARGGALTRRLLAFGKGQVLRPEVVDLSHAVHELERMVHHLLGEDIEVELSLVDDSVTVEVDPGQMEQVLLNLVVNARDAMPEGGALRLETGSQRLDHLAVIGNNTLPPGNWVRVSVMDTGVGMSDETLKRAFEPFYSTKPVGTGLGLAIVYGIVMQSGGHVCIESVLGRGSCVHLFLPAHEPADDGAEKARGGAMVDHREPAPGELILLVDDDDMVRRVLHRALRRAGYRVLSAASGAEALALCERAEHRPALVISDIGMPGMRGTELVAAMRQRRPDIKAVLVSGHIDDHPVAMDVARLQKPVSVHELTATVRALLAGR